MKLLYAGFNLYGQFSNSNELTVNEFTEVDYDRLIDIEFNYSYAVLHTESGIIVHGEDNSKTHQTKRLNFENDVICMSANEDIALFLTSNGEIFKFCFETFELSQVSNFLNTENKTKDDKIVKVQCGISMNIALSRNGYLFNIPNKLQFHVNGVRDICVGREHCLLLTNNGLVYSFGSGSRGQLGHGDLEDFEEPKLVEALNGLKITSIAAGGWHSAALSSDGVLYAWGWNANGQLGLHSADDSDDIPPVVATPTVVDVEDEQDNVVQIACGNRHTVALLDNSKLYGAGWNKYYQLGLELGDDNVNRFVFLYDLADSNVVKLKCAPWATAILIEQP